MHRSLRHSILLGTLLLVSALPALARDRVCGTVTPPAAERAEANRRIATRATACTGGYIHVAFHVINDGTNGNVTQQQIDDQIAELNANYAPWNYHFVLTSVDRTTNATWFHLNSDPTDIAMKNALAIDPAHTLNIYTCIPYEADGVLGYAYFPSSFPEYDKHHGLVLHYETLPGGAFTGFNLGRTATHEIGHYMGLYHTFENGCVAPGDEIDDTPYEANPASGCPIGLDTCPQTGQDPIHNYMDYTDDPCYTEFTPLQAARMCAMVGTYRPSLLQAPPVPVRPSTWGHVKATYR